MVVKDILGVRNFTVIGYYILTGYFFEFFFVLIEVFMKIGKHFFLFY